MHRIALPALLLTLLLHGASTTLRAQDNAAQVEARAAYSAGVEAYGKGEYERAHEQFALAESKFPSPNIELMLARSLIKLDKLVAAHRMLSVARDNAAQAPKYANAASAARDELAELEKRLGVLHLSIVAQSGDETVSVNGEQLAPLAWATPIVVAPGKVRVELARPGAPVERKELSVAPGATATLELKLTPKPKPEPAPVAAAAPAPAAPTTRSMLQPEAPAPAPTPVASAAPPAAPSGGRSQQLRGFSYALAGVGVAGIATFAVFGSMSHTQFSKLEAGCPEPTRCDPALRDNATRGQTYQTLANVALVAGAAALTTAVTLWLVSLPEERAQVAISPGSVRLSGSF